MEEGREEGGLAAVKFSGGNFSRREADLWPELGKVRDEKVFRCLATLVDAAPPGDPFPPPPVRSMHGFGFLGRRSRITPPATPPPKSGSPRKTLWHRAWAHWIQRHSAVHMEVLVCECLHRFWIPALVPL